MAAKYCYIENQYHILHPYSYNTPENENNSIIPEWANAFKEVLSNWQFDVSGTPVTLDMTSILPEITAIAYDLNQDYFGVSYADGTSFNGQISVNGGIALINNIQIDVNDAISTLNVNTFSHYLTNSYPPSLPDSTNYNYLVLHYDKTDVNDTAKFAFVQNTQYESVKDKCCLLKIFKLITDSGSNIISVQSLDYDPNPGYESNFVIRLMFWDKMQWLLDGGWIDNA